MKTIQTDKAPLPAGHYSQAVVHEGLVYVAGQLPIKPGHKPQEPGDIKEQARQVLRNLEAILTEAGSGLNHVLKVTVYISDITLWGQVNDVYAEHFGDHRPARAMVPTRDLHFGYQIEMDAVAAVNNQINR